MEESISITPFYIFGSVITAFTCLIYWGCRIDFLQKHTYRLSRLFVSVIILILYIITILFSVIPEIYNCVVLSRITGSLLLYIIVIILYIILNEVYMFSVCYDCSEKDRIRR